MDRIKGIRQKTGADSYSALVPFGADAEFIDFLSGLDLEQQLKIGGNHVTKITENSDTQTTIVEKYYNENGSSNDSDIEYTIVTIIVQNPNNSSVTVTMSLYKGNQTTTALHSKTITIEDTVQQSKSVTNIQEALS